MKITHEANTRILKEINEMQKRWKEIEETTKKALALPATQPTSTFNNGTYKTGDGEKLQPIRPGGVDHKKWPSKGLLSDVPNNVEEEHD